MDPNQQPSEDSTNSNEPTTQFGTPEQFNPQADTPVSSESESLTSMSEPAPTVAAVSPEPQFGQSASPDTTEQPPVAEPVSAAAPAPEAAQATPQQPVAPAGNPGQTLGIVSIILSFVGLSVIGIVLAIISRKKSKEANASTTLGTIGLVLGITFTLLVVLWFAFFSSLLASGISASL